jgi:threo-3-hydroxy-L-aspartate ammonia-lyase
VVLELRDVEAAAERLRGIAAKTPVLTSRTLDARTGAHVFVKAECFQRGGAFKFRGAYNKISQVAESCRGIAAFSSGNHAQAVALASAAVGLPATILMPADAPEAKVEATRGYGAEVVTYDRYSEDRERLGQALAAEQGLELVPPYDDPLVMAGQGTVALELLEEVGAVDVLVVPVGGGGLAAGCATVVKALAPHARVVGVEPEAADDTRQSLERGERIEIPVSATIADGLQVSAPGRLTFEVNRRLVDEVVTVSDAELVEAMQFLFERMKVVAEPSGAAAVAALLAARVSLPGGRMAAVLSGGNVGAQRFCALLADAH